MVSSTQVFILFTLLSLLPHLLFPCYNFPCLGTFFVNHFCSRFAFYTPNSVSVWGHANSCCELMNFLSAQREVMRHDKGMFLSSCSCCSRGLSNLLSHCHGKVSPGKKLLGLWLGSRQEEGRARVEKAENRRRAGGRWGWWAVPLSLLKCHLLCHQVSETNDLHDMISTGKQIKELLKQGNQLVPGGGLWRSVSLLY